MTYLLTALFIGHSWGISTCPKSFTQEGVRVEWVCKTKTDGVNYREKRTSHADSKEFIEIDFFNGTNRPYRRDVYETRFGLKGKYFFTYQSDREADFKFSNIKLYDFNDALIAEHSAEVSKEKIELSRNEISVSPPKVIIIDSGFNYTHEKVFGKHFVNELEVLDGLDNDEDGLIDNITTFNGQQGAGGSVNYKFNLNQLIQLPTKGAPFTHGGFVAGVAMRDINHTSYMGAGGDIHSAVYLYKILEQINKYEVRFTNMSFGFGDKSGISIVDKESIEAVEGIMRASFNTLHVVASGNGSRNFDEIKYTEYPACINTLNKVTVGALNTGEIVEEEMINYEQAFFSNIGSRCVDIMAPGVDMLGAGIGDTMMKASGTSVASPYVLNVLLKMHSVIDSLKSREYRALLLKTAYVPKVRPFDAKSGGAVFPRRAILAAEKVRDGMTIEEAIWSSRGEVELSGELSDKNELIALWKSRKLR